MRRDSLSPVISNLRFPLALMVVYIHSFGFGECDLSDLNILHLSSYDIYNIVRTLISKVICQIAVPLFFFFSGYLFFKKLETWNWETYKTKISKRFFTLLIPYIIWNTIRFFSNSYFSDTSLSDFSLTSFWHDGYVDAGGYTNWFGTVISISHPIHVAFWFIRDLIVMVLLSPAIYYILRKAGTLFVIFLLFCFLSSIWPTFPGQSIRSVFFFTIGAFICIRQIDLISYLEKNRVFIYGITFTTCFSVTFLGGGVKEVYEYLFPIFVLTGCGTIILLSSNYKPEKQICSFLGRCSFLLYAVHPILLLLKAQYLNSHIHTDNVIILVAIYLITPIIIAIICIPAYYIIEKHTKVLRILLIGK